MSRSACLGGMVSESFRQQLYASFEQLLHEHEQIVAHFADAVATLCESEACDGRAIANALRELSGDSPRSIVPASRMAATATDATATATFGTQSLRHFESLQAPSEAPKLSLPSSSSGGQNMRPQSILHIEKEEYSMSPRGAKVMRKISNKKKSGIPGQLSGTLEGCNVEDVTRMQNLFHVHRLKFLSADCKISKPPSHWREHLGPVGKPLEALVHRVSDWISKLGEPKPSIWLRLVESHWFKAFSLLAITLNYFFIIFSTDWRTNHLSDDDPIIFRIIDLSFTSYYALELLISILALRGDFFFGFDCGWNWFDIVIVFFSVFQEVLLIWNIESIDTSFLRVLRFLRISKILRMFEAMRMFKEVKIMVDSIQGSFVVFAMCCLLLALYLSIFAIFFVQGITTKLAEDAQLVTGELSADQKDIMIEHFGTCSGAMVTLFQALTGGRDWDEYYQVVQDMGWVYSLLFLFFFLFALMSIFNVVTGVFCEKAMSLARPGPLEQQIRRQQKDLRDASELIHLLKKHLKLKEPLPPISSEKFAYFVEQEEVSTYFEARGMHVGSAHRFFEVLAGVSQEDEIDIATFVSACVTLDGPASSIDLHILDIEMKAIQIALYHTHFQLAEQIEKLGVRLESSLRDDSGRPGRQNSYGLNDADDLRHIANISKGIREPQTPAFDSSHVVINHDFSHLQFPSLVGIAPSPSQDAPLLPGGHPPSLPSVQFRPEADTGGNVVTFHCV